MKEGRETKARRAPNRSPDPRSLKPYRCRRCGSGDFYLANGGRWRACRPCHREDSRRSYQTDPQDRAKRKARAAAYRATEHGRRVQRNATIRYLYGVTAERYDAMLVAQEGVCAICSRPNRNGLPLYVDHCHQSGNVRALLCITCNHGLGSFSDNPETLRLAADYLEKFAALASLRGDEK